jgi:hypothetical protein
MTIGNGAAQPAAHIVKVACDDHRNGGCQRPIVEITADSSGDVMILGPLRAQNNDPGGTLTARVPDMQMNRRRNTAAVVDTTDPAERQPPQLRTDRINARRMAHEAGRPGPDGLSYDEGLAKEIAEHEQLLRTWDPAGTTSGTGPRLIACKCRRRPYAAVSQAQLNAAYLHARTQGKHRITLDDLRMTVL